ncbi:MAG: hypothetical protein U0836_04010 [Pirellulales bacterium]
MTELTPASRADFLSRFYELADSVVRRVELKYTPGRRLTVVLSAQDSLAPDGWSNVRFLISDVKEFQLREGKSTCEVISYAFLIEWFDGAIVLDFSPETEHPGGMEEIRRSDFYVAGKQAFWEVGPYSEE